VLVHRVVEALDQSANVDFAADALEGRLIAAGRFTQERLVFSTRAPARFTA
jgi:hypothetical protein